MRVNFTTVMRQWLRREDGGALAELAILHLELYLMDHGLDEMGESALDLVVADARGGALNNEAAYQRLGGLHRALERHRDVGSVISIAPLMAETTTTTWLPFAWVSATRFATRLMPSASDTEEPPNFCTIKLMRSRSLNNSWTVAPAFPGDP